jgi:hypothetical protein
MQGKSRFIDRTGTSSPAATVREAYIVGLLDWQT